MPFDVFCPWLVKKGTLARRCCGTCGKYFPIVAAKNQHLAAHVAISRHWWWRICRPRLIWTCASFRNHARAFYSWLRHIAFVIFTLYECIFFYLYCNKLSLLFLCKMCLCKFILSIYLVFRTYISYVTEMCDITGWGGVCLKVRKCERVGENAPKSVMSYLNSPLLFFKIDCYFSKNINMLSFSFAIMINDSKVMWFTAMETFRLKYIILLLIATKSSV